MILQPSDLLMRSSSLVASGTTSTGRTIGHSLADQADISYSMGAQGSQIRYQDQTSVGTVVETRSYRMALLT